MTNSTNNKTEATIVHDFANEYFSNSKYIHYLEHRYIDLAIYPPNSDVPLLFAEAKQRATEINVMFAQLIFTIYKTYKTEFSPQFLCVFDTEKVAFIPFSAVEHLYNEYKTADFDWTVTPSNHNTKEFKIIAGLVKAALEKENSLCLQENLHNFKETLFYFAKDKNEIKEWIRLNIDPDAAAGPLEITDKNAPKVYYRWREVVMPTINEDWSAVRTRLNILDCDYFLADLFSEDNSTMNEKLYVLLKSNYYKMVKDPLHLQQDIFNERSIQFTDKQVAHNQFWQKYKRPPEDEYWDIILKRRDLLVPLDIRQRLGAFFTPPEMVKLSQQYMAEAFGDLSEYYIWDCAAGTGNLLQGLERNGTNYNLFASDVNIENVYVMKGRIAEGTLNIPESHAFQFDFLNDRLINSADSGYNTEEIPYKLPSDLQDIISDPEKRKRLIIYINPPFVEAGNVMVVGDRKNKTEVSNTTHVWNNYKDKLGLAIRELFAQFYIRIYTEIPNCKLAAFGKLKYICGYGFIKFRAYFEAKFKKGFLMPADIFDNVNGQFPIGFHIFDTEIKKKITNCKFDVYDGKKVENWVNGAISIKKRAEKKKVYCYDNKPRITDWMKKFDVKSKENIIGYTGNNGPDFQNNHYVHISSIQKINSNNTLNNATKYSITQANLIPICIYFAVRKVIPANWLNDRDQFLYPNIDLTFKADAQGGCAEESLRLFHADCLAYSLFHNGNNIQSSLGVNYWLPFTEEEVSPKKLFKSHFMTDFISGKFTVENKENDIFNSSNNFAKSKIAKDSPRLLEFSPQAKELFNAGRKLWQYYHSVAKNDENYLNDASFYDIRKYFQSSRGAVQPASTLEPSFLSDIKAHINTKSSNAKYNELINELRKALKKLGEERIVEKVFEYGFLLD